MEIILFAHPVFLKHQSMPRFVKMLEEGMIDQGHKVEVWTADAFFSKISNKRILVKWLAYVDQFIVFPILTRKRVRRCNQETLFVLTDHALGPWFKLIKKRAHVVHCHDFLAQKSAIGQIPENKTGITGKIYQRFIRCGYSKAKNFISVSNNTRNDLCLFLKNKPQINEVVYNGINKSFSSYNPKLAIDKLITWTGINLKHGFILHVGGNQWYKNRLGVLDIYDAWRSKTKKSVPLLLIGEEASTELNLRIQSSPYSNDIFSLSKMTDEQVRMAYCSASLFLFPSNAEGFGWPIAEAMASGCPVITTNLAPMTEVAANAGFYISPKPLNLNEFELWKHESAKAVDLVLNLSNKERNLVISSGIENIKRFSTKLAINKIEKIYLKVLEDFINSN